MPKYKFSARALIPEELLKAIGREDIPSTEVLITIVGNDVEIDFGVVLTEVDEKELKKILEAMGLRFVEKE